MASLKEMFEKSNIDPKSSNKLNEIPSIDTSKNEGRKRRSWLTENGTAFSPRTKDEKKSKGSIDPVYQPLTSKGSIDWVPEPRLSTPSINPVYQPLTSKGSIDGVDRPRNFTLENLRSNPLKILQLLYELTKDGLDPKITLKRIQNLLNLSRDSARTGLRFLLYNKLVERIDFKPGNNGWSKYKIKTSLFEETKIAYQKGGVNPLNIDLTKPDSKGSISSSNNIKTTTTEKNDEWNFDITSYARFGFTATQVKQLASLEVIQPSQVEQSLIEFNYDLDNNALPPIKTNKINFLMGLLRSGHSYVSEGFQNEQEATISEMARRAEEKRKNLLEARFGAWEANLSDDERKLVLSKLPPSLMVLEKTYGIDHQEVRKAFVDYFMRNEKDITCPTS